MPNFDKYKYTYLVLYFFSRKYSRLKIIYYCSLVFVLFTTHCRYVRVFFFFRLLYNSAEDDHLNLIIEIVFFIF